MTTQTYGSLREKIAAEKKERELKHEQFKELYELAQREGFAAGEAIKPRAMHIVEADIFGKPLANGQSWIEDEGLCGFAWVIIRPATSSFARWLKKHELARTAYHGGMQIWISAHNQSVERKEAHANAMAKVFREAGIDAYADSRLD